MGRQARRGLIQSTLKSTLERMNGLNGEAGPAGIETVTSRNSTLPRFSAKWGGRPGGDFDERNQPYSKGMATGEKRRQARCHTATARVNTAQIRKNGLPP